LFSCSADGVKVLVDCGRAVEDSITGVKFFMRPGSGPPGVIPQATSALAVGQQGSGLPPAAATAAAAPAATAAADSSLPSNQLVGVCPMLDAVTGDFDGRVEALARGHAGGGRRVRSGQRVAP
jgi:hypothetical protein